MSINFSKRTVLLDLPGFSKNFCINNLRLYNGFYYSGFIITFN